MNNLNVSLLACLDKANLIEFLRDENHIIEAEVLKTKDIDGKTFLELKETDMVQWRLTPIETKLILKCREAVLVENSQETTKKTHSPKTLSMRKRSNSMTKIVQNTTELMESKLNFNKRPGGNINIKLSGSTANSKSCLTSTNYSELDNSFQQTNMTKLEPPSCRQSANPQQINKYDRADTLTLLNPSSKVNDTVLKNNQIQSRLITTEDGTDSKLTKPNICCNKSQRLELETPLHIWRGKPPLVVRYPTIPSKPDDYTVYPEETLYEVEPTAESLEHIFESLHYEYNHPSLDTQGHNNNYHINYGPSSTKFANPGFTIQSPLKPKERIRNNSPVEFGLPKPPVLDNSFEQAQIKLVKNLVQEYDDVDTSSEEFNPNTIPYYRNTDREGAVQILETISNLRDGVFLFRNSKKYVLAITTYFQNRFYSVGVDRYCDGSFYCKTEYDEGIVTFKTLHDFVDYYEKNPLTVNSKGLNVDIYLRRTANLL